MTLGLLGKKLGMTRIYDDAGMVIPVTVIQAGPCPILQIKSKEKDGYTALQVGFEPSPNARSTVPKPVTSSGRCGSVRVVREFRAENWVISTGRHAGPGLVRNWRENRHHGDFKGRGFAGVQKRHHSSRGPETHGSMYHRRTGSMGASADPSRVFKRKRAPGHMGAERVTMQNLTVLKVIRKRT
jgi:large subunit ribosomal protein L3